MLSPTHINNENDNINFVLIYTVQERYDSWSEFGDVWQHWRWCMTSSVNSDWAELQPYCHIHAPAKENSLARSTEIIYETYYSFLHSNLEPWNCWLLSVTKKVAIGRQFSSNETCLKAVEVKLKVRLHLGLSVPVMSQATLLNSSENIPKISMLTWMITQQTDICRTNSMYISPSPLPPKKKFSSHPRC